MKLLKLPIFFNISKKASQLIFESALLHMNDLKQRPLKQEIIFDYFGNDVGNIILLFIPICEFKTYELDAENKDDWIQSEVHD